VDGADVVLSLNSADAALPAARSVVGALAAGKLFADLNSAGAPLKRELASLIEASGALFADVALMAPVPGNGLRTPALVSGSGAELFAERLGTMGMPVKVVGPEPGQAAARKLLRSVFMKGLAATAIEALSAAAAAGCEAWLREEIAAVLESADAALLERLETGSRKHAARRAHEMEDASALLRELGLEPRISEASIGWLRQLRDEGMDG
jgi:3-hydroxyisobutyrate dehydrogenase-like beta-hydroxyacid dehydrogenase